MDDNILGTLIISGCLILGFLTGYKCRELYILIKLKKLQKKLKEAKE